MSDLPKCRLCGAGARIFPALNGVQWIIHDVLDRGYCSLEHTRILIDEWRALMAPPVVTDAMVERGAGVLMDSFPWTARDIARDVLEAAMKE
ncbi:hypothetical protein [Nitratidesulfovibrio sp. 1201_IL3209]|uniref:hypothetical protein n=1 Tax=Nitratidesulfovibrio sp. 1201_IL3209 TaxID=3084053 RepID=UPI002FDAACA2